MSFGTGGAGGGGRLPFSAIPNRTIAALGDSITYHGIQSNTSPTWEDSTLGYTAWVPFLSYGRVSLPITNNFGVNGDDTVGMLARIGAVLAVNPAVCIVLAGTNDCSAGRAAADIIKNLTAIYDAFSRSGIVVIAIPILGRNLAFTASAGADIAQSVNAWIRSQAFVRKNFYVANCQSVFDDVSSTSFGCLSTMVDSGGLHPGPLGAYTIANQIVPILQSLFPEPFSPLWHQADKWSADNVRGCLNTNGTMQGTSGSLGSTLGTLATSWGSSNGQLGGGTATWSKSTFADGRACQQLDLSGNYTGTTSRVDAFSNLSGNFANIAPGDVLEATMELQVSASSSNLAGVTLMLQMTIGGQLYVVAAMFPNTSFTAPGVAHSGIVRTLPFTIPSGTITTGTITARTLFANVGATSSALAATIKFGSVAVRKIVS